MDTEPGAPLVTVSVGIATCADDASDYDGLFECADRRLYLAKSRGRDCVMGAGPAALSVQRIA
jgi:GGDEF domain-containing protein